MARSSRQARPATTEVIGEREARFFEPGKYDVKDQYNCVGMPFSKACVGQRIPGSAMHHGELDQKCCSVALLKASGVESGILSLATCEA